jgi:hypothetical protein
MALSHDTINCLKILSQMPSREWQIRHGPRVVIERIIANDADEIDRDVAANKDEAIRTLASFLGMA